MQNYTVMGYFCQLGFEDIKGKWNFKGCYNDDSSEHKKHCIYLFRKHFYVFLFDVFLCLNLDT